MSSAHIPQDPDERARLVRQSFLRMLARMLSIRARRAGNPAAKIAETQGGGLPNSDMTEDPSVRQAAHRLPIQPGMTGGS